MTEPTMIGRNCIVTGANSGIGKATALGLARVGATVLMVCRDRVKGEVAQAEIQHAAGDALIDLFTADLASQAQVRQLAAEIQQHYAHVHVLIHNAGLQLQQRTLTADGIETTLAVNHLAPFLLTHLLFDMLKASTPSRIITVSSLVHKWGKLDFDNLQLESGYTMDRAYNQSKLCSVLFTRELARQLVGTRVTANSLEPGLVKTDFGRAYTGAQAWFVRNIWLRLFAQPPEQGARTSVYLASSPQVEGVSGEHFVSCRSSEPAPAARDSVLAQRLWDESAKLTHLQMEAAYDPA
jgi:NAD(P)-dependent dehydrogenase (short-subunit alcohol dehydrogenase family)